MIFIKTGLKNNNFGNLDGKVDSPCIYPLCIDQFREFVRLILIDLVKDFLCLTANISSH